MGWTLRINNVDRTAWLKPDSWRYTLPINGIGESSFTLYSGDGSYIPREMDNVAILFDNAPAWLGTITNIDVQFLGGYSGVVTECSCVHNAHRLTRVYRNGNVGSVFGGTQTLKAALQDLSQNLIDQGITIDPSQTNGPDIETQWFSWATIEECLNHLWEITGWTWFVSSSNTLIMRPIGGWHSGRYFSPANGNIHEVSWSRTTAEYRNVQWVLFGGLYTREDEYQISGNGTSRELEVPVINPVRGPREAEIVWGGGGSTEILVGRYPDDVGGKEWLWKVNGSPPYFALWQDPDFGNPPLGATDKIHVTVERRLNDQRVVDDPIERAAHGTWMAVNTDDAIREPVAAEEWGYALIRNSKPRPIRPTIVTGGAFVSPGTMVGLDVPTIGIPSGDYLVDNVTAQFHPSASTLEGGFWRYTLTCVGSNERQRTPMEFWKEVLGGSGRRGISGVTAGSIVGMGGEGGGGTGGDYRAQVLIFLGGRRDRSTMHSGWAAVPDYVAAVLDKGAFSMSLSLRYWARVQSAGHSFTIRLRNVTLGVNAAISAPITSTGWVEASIPVILSEGVNYYVLEVLPGASTHECYCQGYISSV
jgi:hypothetical protein